MPWPLYCYYKWWGDGIGGGGWLILGCEWGQGVSFILELLFFSFAFIFCCLTFSVTLFRWLEHDGCCVIFFVFPLCSLCLVAVTRSNGRFVPKFVTAWVIFSLQIATNYINLSCLLPHYCRWSIVDFPCSIQKILQFFTRFGIDKVCQIFLPFLFVFLCNSYQFYNPLDIIGY